MQSIYDKCCRYVQAGPLKCAPPRRQPHVRSRGVAYLLDIRTPVLPGRPRRPRRYLERLCRQVRKSRQGRRVDGRQRVLGRVVRRADGRQDDARQALVLHPAAGQVCLFLSAQISASSPPTTRRMQNALRIPVIASTMFNCAVKSMCRASISSASSSEFPANEMKSILRSKCR